MFSKFKEYYLNLVFFVLSIIKNEQNMFFIFFIIKKCFEKKEQNMLMYGEE